MIIIPIPRAKTGMTGAKINHIMFPIFVYFSVLPAMLEMTELSLKTVMMTIKGEKAMIAHNIPTLISNTRASAIRGMTIHIAAATFMINSMITPLVVVLAIASETDVILEKSRIEM